MSTGPGIAPLSDQLTEPSERTVITLNEWSTSDETYSLTDADRDVLESEVNDEATRIRVTYTQHGQARFHARQFVGVVSLPDGPVIQIRPKAAGGNLLHLLRYAQEIAPTTATERTSVEQGASFVDALAALFTTELESVLQRGLHRRYQATSATRSHVRGRINVQRQLQRQGTTPTAFECHYSEQTQNTVTNQAVLYAGTLLQRMVADSSLQQTLDRQTAELRQSVDLQPVSPRELDAVDLTRLDDYYADLLRLSEPVLRNMYIENLESGFQETYSLLINMNTLFERAVERGLRNVLDEYTTLDLTPQARTTSLVQGEPTVRLYPDFVIDTADTESSVTRCVGDMKWKTGDIDNDDIYQMTSYILARDSPGVLVYPVREESAETEYTIDDRYQLSVIELATDCEDCTYDEFVTEFEDSVEEKIVRYAL